MRTLGETPNGNVVQALAMARLARQLLDKTPAAGAKA
jgi:hypothetical protein